jgi:hypothetical protein
VQGTILAGGGVTQSTEYVTHTELREFELRWEVRITDFENRMLREISSMRNWIISVMAALVLPLYILIATVLIFLYNAKP